MNRGAMLPRSLVAAISLLLVACQGQSASNAGPTADGVDLRGASLGGPFTLTSETGRPAKWSDFDGQYRIVYFGFAYCPDICPTDVQRTMTGLKQFEERHPELGAKIQPLFISVDPARDTPAVLREFTDNFHPRLIGMTGDDETLKKVAQSFGASFSKGEVTPGGGYLMNHSTLTYLFGPDGEPMGTLPTDKGAEAVAAELESWLG